MGPKSKKEAPKKEEESRPASAKLEDQLSQVTSMWDMDENENAWAVWCTKEENEAWKPYEVPTFVDFEPTGKFGEDFLKINNTLNSVPHPQVKKLLEKNLKAAVDAAEAEEREFPPTLADVDITAVDVRGHRIDHATLGAICVSTKACATLTTMTLWHVALRPFDLVMLAQAVKDSEITELALDFACDVGSFGREDLYVEFPVEPEEPAEGEEPPADAEGDEEEKLVEQETVETTKSCSFLELMLDGCKLSYLSLRGNHFTDEFASDIAALIEKNRTLVALSLCNNKFTDEGVKLFEMPLSHNHTLVCLSLGMNKFGCAGASALASALYRFPISEEEVADRAEKQAAYDVVFAEWEKAANDAKKKKKDPPPRPDVLVLPQVVQVDGVMFADGNRTLTNLDLMNNDIADEGATALGEMMKSNRVVTRLSLDSNNISEKQAGILKDIMTIAPEEPAADEEEGVPE